jgi:uncharacterized protein
MVSRRRALRWIILIALVWVVFWGVPQLSRFYTDWLWFRGEGYNSIFWRSFWAQIITGLVFGLGFLLILFGNAHIAYRVGPKSDLLIRRGLFRDPALEVVEKIISRGLGWLALALCLFISLIAGIQAAGNWFSVLTAFNPTPFGKTEALFNTDLAFYVFRLPLLEMLQSYLAAALVFSFLLAAGIHYYRRAIRSIKGVPTFSPQVKIHLSLLLSAWFLTKAWDYWLQTRNLVYSEHGVVFGASYTDVNARLFALYILLGVAVLGALAVLINLRFRGFVLPLGAIGLLIVASILGGLYPAAVQNFRVAPTERSLEAPYIKRNIQATLFGFGLEKVKNQAFPAFKTITQDTLEKEAVTLDNVRLWDHRPLLETYQQKQRLQPYYTFHDVDIDRYTIDGKYRQVMLSARELDLDNLPSKEWQNEHLFYTHGFGAVLSPVNEVTGEGEPQLLIRDIPPISMGLQAITQPRIYYGEIAQTDQYSLVRTNEKEKDYPLSGSQTATTTYSGSGGIPLGGALNQIALGMRFGDKNLFFSKNITSQTRLIFRRAIADKLQTLAPFFAYDYDPYIVIADDGRLYWVQDAYTVTGRLPYSQPYQLFPDRSDLNVNYIRNSVKIVMDAYNGKVKFYGVDRQDPILSTLGKIFPGLLSPLGELPSGLQKHFRCPEELFFLQARVFATYHMTDPQLFYSKQDKWDIAREKGGKQTSAREELSTTPPSEGETMQAYYALMRLPGAQKSEFILMIPFTPLRRPNMVAWMATRCDPEHYGEIVTYEFPRDKQVWGPIQFEGKIDQQGELSKLFSWWDQRGSSVVRGNLLVIPLGQSVLYVEPIFLKAQVGAIPQLKLVVVGKQEGDNLEVDFGPNLERALATAVGTAPPLTAETLLEVSDNIAAAQAEKPPAEVPAKTPPSEGLATEKQIAARKALEHYQRAQELLRSGDLAGYQRELEKMEPLLQDLAK